LSTVLDDQVDLARVPYVLQGIPVDNEKIRQLTRLDRTQAGALAHRLGHIARCRLYRLQGGKTRIDKKLQLAMQVQSVHGHWTGMRPREDWSTGAIECGDELLDVRISGLVLLSCQVEPSARIPGYNSPQRQLGNKTVSRIRQNLAVLRLVLPIELVN